MFVCVPSGCLCGFFCWDRHWHVRWIGRRHVQRRLILGFGYQANYEFLLVDIQRTNLTAVFQDFTCNNTPKVKGDFLSSVILTRIN